MAAAGAVKGGGSMGVFELAVVAGLAALALAVFLRTRRRGDDDALARQLGAPGGCGACAAAAGRLGAARQGQGENS